MTELQRLQLLDVSIHMATRNGLTALATKHFLDWQFYGLPEAHRPAVFRANPANNFLYLANEAVIDTSIVEVVEQIKAEDIRKALPFSVPDWADLRRHRIVLSHPANIFFKEPEVQQFFDRREHYRDGKKALRLWRTREALISKMVDFGGEVKFPNGVVVQAGTIELIHGVLLISMTSQEVLPSKDELAKACFDYFAIYEAAIRRSVVDPK